MHLGRSRAESLRADNRIKGTLSNLVGISRLQGVQMGDLKMKTGSLLAIIVFVLVAIAHLLRIASGTEIVIGGNNIPQWISVVGVVIPAFIAWLLWKESKIS